MIVGNISGRDLKKVVMNVGRFIPRNSYHTQHITLTQKDGGLYFYDDGNIYTQWLPTDDAQEGSIAVDFKEFNNFAKACSTKDTIQLMQANSTDGPVLAAITGSIRKVFSGTKKEIDLLPWDFRDDKDYYWVTMREAELYKVLGGASITYEKNDNRPILGSIFFEFKDDEYRITATDGFRIISYFGECPGKYDFDFQLEGSAITTYLKTYKPKNDITHMRILVRDKYCIFSREDSQCVINKVEGTYPNYRSVFPPAEGKRTWGFDIDAELLKQAIKQASVFDALNQENVRIWRDTDNLLVSRGTTENYRDVAVEVKPDNIYDIGKIYLNANYLTDMLNQCRGQACVRFGGPDLNPETTAVQFYQPTFLGLIMPVAETGKPIW